MRRHKLSLAYIHTHTPDTLQAQTTKPHQSGLILKGCLGKRYRYGNQAFTLNPSCFVLSGGFHTQSLPTKTSRLLEEPELDKKVTTDRK